MSITDDFSSLDETTDDISEAVEEERPLYYPHAEAWVQGWLLPHFRRNPNTRRWRDDWWMIEEVQLIIEALWESWEYYRYEGATGLLVFLRDYFYPMMDVINSEDGPLWNYDPPRQTGVPDMWTVTDAPAGMYEEPED